MELALLLIELDVLSYGCDLLFECVSVLRSILSAVCCSPRVSVLVDLISVCSIVVTLFGHEMLLHESSRVLGAPWLLGRELRGTMPARVGMVVVSVVMAG